MFSPKKYWLLLITQNMSVQQIQKHVMSQGFFHLCEPLKTMVLHFLFSEDRSLIVWSSGEACGLWARLGRAEASQLHLLAIGNWTENPSRMLVWSGKKQRLVVESIADSLERNSWAMALIAVLICSQVKLGYCTSQSCVTQRRRAWKDSNDFEIGSK